MVVLSLQEKVSRVSDEIEKLKEELSDVKNRLQKKKDELKSLKKQAHEQNSEEGEIVQEAIVDLSKNEFPRALLFDNLKVNNTGFVCSIPNTNPDPELVDSSQFFSSDASFFHEDRRRNPLSFTSIEPRSNKSSPSLSHSSKGSVMSRATGMLMGLSPKASPKREERDHIDSAATPTTPPRYPSPLKKIRPFNTKSRPISPTRGRATSPKNSSPPPLSSPTNLILPPPSFASAFSRTGPSSPRVASPSTFVSSEPKGPCLRSSSSFQTANVGTFSQSATRSRSPVPFSQVQRSMRSSNLTTATAVPQSSSSPPPKVSVKQESAPKISSSSGNRDELLGRERGKRCESEKYSFKKSVVSKMEDQEEYNITKVVINKVSRDDLVKSADSQKIKAITKGEEKSKQIGSGSEGKVGSWKDSYTFESDEEGDKGEEEEEGGERVSLGGDWEHDGASYMLHEDIPDPTPYLLYEVDKSEGDQSSEEDSEASGEESEESEEEAGEGDLNYALHTGEDNVNYSLHAGDDRTGKEGDDSVNYALHTTGEGEDNINYSLHAGVGGGEDVNYSLHSGGGAEGVGDNVNYSVHVGGRGGEDVQVGGGEGDVNYSLHTESGDKASDPLHRISEEATSSPEPPSGLHNRQRSMLVGVGREGRDKPVPLLPKPSRGKLEDVGGVKEGEKKGAGVVIERGTKEERENKLEAVKKGLSVGDRWSERFQQCLQKLRNLGEYSAQEEKVVANTELMHLSEDFVCASRTVGKIIISEVYLPFEDKVIKPITDLGGQAGGDKYIVHNILFKFALDSNGLFGGSDLSAAKVSGHELKGLMAYFSVGMHDVNFPLMTLVDYRGFRLVAISVLPVGKNTIIYGTADGGRSYHNSNRDFSKEMDEAAEKLNLKPHLCGSSKFRMVRLAAAADIEGHRGVDGKFYLLDFSRTMPPVAPQTEKYYNGHLFYLFRREFVRANSKPLCSDAFSGFISQDRNAKKHNLEVEKATKKLLQQTIPQYAQRLFQSALIHTYIHTGAFQFDVTAHMHKTGVNLRYIGLVVKEFQKTMKDKNQKLVSSVVGTLLIEAVARVVKNDLNLQMREETKKLMLPLEVPYRKLAVDYMNKVFGRGKASENWWHNTLPPLLNKHFNVEKGDRVSDLRQFLLFGLPEGRVMLFRRILGLTGLVFSENIMKKFADRSIWMSEPVDYLDLLEIGERVKCMDIVSLSQGNFFLYKALVMQNDKVKEDLLLQAISRYEEALNSNANKETLMNCSIAHFNYLASKADRKEWFKEEGEMYFDPADTDVQRAESHFQRLVSTDEKNGKSLCLYAMFLVCCQEYVKAESHFIRSLQASPSPYTLTEYLYFLDRCRITNLADHAYRCIVEKTTQTIVSPFTGKELGGIIKVFTENGSFKSMKITGVTSTSDILVQVSNSLKMKFDHDRWQLVGVDAGVPLRQISDEAWKDNEEWERVMESAVKRIIFKPTDLPWVYLQRPNYPYFLYLRRVPSPSSSEAVGGQLLALAPSPPPQHSSLRKKEVITDLIVPSSHDPSLEHFLTLLFVSPLLVPLPELKEKLLQTALNSRSARVMELWSYYFSDDLTQSEFDSFLQATGGEGGAKLSSGWDGEGFGRMKQRKGEEVEAYLSHLGKMVDSSVPSIAQLVRGGEGGGRAEVELDSLSISALLFPTTTASIGDKEEDYQTPPPQKKQGGWEGGTTRGGAKKTKPSLPWKIREMGNEGITELAQLLRVWAFSVQFPIVERDFLLFACALGGRGEIPYSLFMGLSYEYLISKWVMGEILGGEESEDPPSPTDSLQSFSAFIDLANESCRIGDVATSAAIIDALNSDEMHIAQVAWAGVPEHRVVRTKFGSSVPFLYFSSSADRETGEYVSLYDNAMQVLKKGAEGGGVYITSLRRLCLYIASLGGIVEGGGGEGGGSAGAGGGGVGGGAALSGVVTYALFDLVSRYGIGGLQRGKWGCLSFFEQAGGTYGGEGEGIELQKELCSGPLRQIALYFLRTDRIQTLLSPKVPFLIDDERMSSSLGASLGTTVSPGSASFSSARQRLSFLTSESRTQEGDKPLSPRRGGRRGKGGGALSRDASGLSVGAERDRGRSRGLFRQFTEMTLNKDDQSV